MSVQLRSIIYTHAMFGSAFSGAPMMVRLFVPRCRLHSSHHHKPNASSGTVLRI